MSREEAESWIVWNEGNYAEHGFGLWIVELNDGTFMTPTSSSLRRSPHPRPPDGCAASAVRTASRAASHAASPTTVGTIAPGWPRPHRHGPALSHHPSMSALTLPCDSGTYCIGLVTSAKDRALRALREEPASEATARLSPRRAVAAARHTDHRCLAHRRHRGHPARLRPRRPPGGDRAGRGR